MKFTVIISILFIAACSGKQKTKSSLFEDGDHCYQYVLSLDTISMQIHINGNQFTGKMDYQFFEKDQSHGTISGKIEGDKIIGDYKFSSEGLESVSQIIFKKQENDLMVGFGEMEEKDGRFIYKDPENLRFETFILGEINCK